MSIENTDKVFRVPGEELVSSADMEVIERYERRVMLLTLWSVREIGGPLSQEKLDQISREAAILVSEINDVLPRYLEATSEFDELFV